MARRSRHPRPLWRVIVEAILVVPLAGVLFGLPMLHFIQQIRAGRGLDQYLNGYGAKTNAIIGLVGFALIVPVVLGVVFISVWRDIRARWKSSS